MSMQTSRSNDFAVPSIPLLLLKTRSEPNDAYEDYCTLTSQRRSIRSATPEAVPSPSSYQCHFDPHFVPVLVHKQNEQALSTLAQLLKGGKLKEQYGGMIFTSQRAVEAWADTVRNAEEQIAQVGDGCSGMNTATDTRTGSSFTTDILTTTPFPLYVVGPATARAIETLISTLPTQSSSFLHLNPSIHGSHAGSGANLAPFILHHYNAIHQQTWFTYHDAPRLPFIPLIGMGSENYSRRRLEPDDSRLQKKPLLFLVGEQRRDIIPKTLTDEKLGNVKIQVEEVEVYSTIVREDFRKEFEITIHKLRAESAHRVVVIVVFSPQGSGDMLKAIGRIDEDGRKREKEKEMNTNTNTALVSDEKTENHPRYVIVTIGPTTRDYLLREFGVEPDVCAKTPSPEGVGEAVTEFLREKGWQL